MNKSDEAFKKKLTPEQYRIMRQKGTEAPFTGKYVNEHAPGTYKCAACGQELFSSDTKFDSGTGWPSFTDPVNKKNIELREDKDGGTRPPGLRPGEVGQVSRVEVICKNCGSHLGHVFDDLPRVAGKAGGPAGASGKRYCINSACLELQKEEEKAVEVDLEINADQEEAKEEKTEIKKGSSNMLQNIAMLFGAAIAGTAIGAAAMNYAQPIICPAINPPGSAAVNIVAPVLPASQSASAVPETAIVKTPAKTTSAVSSSSQSQVGSVSNSGAATTSAPTTGSDRGSADSAGTGFGTGSSP